MNIDIIKSSETPRESNQSIGEIDFDDGTSKVLNINDIHMVIEESNRHQSPSKQMISPPKIIQPNYQTRKMNDNENPISEDLTPVSSAPHSAESEKSISLL